MIRETAEDVTIYSKSPIDAPPPAAVDCSLDPEEAEQVRRSYLLKRFWLSARGFWGANGDILAWVFSGGLVALIIINVAIQYRINVWNRSIFDALEQRDAATVFV